MLDHIKLGADFMTTCLTTFRTGLPGDSSTTRTLYQSFRTKKHVLDAISRKKLYLVAWGGRGRKFKHVSFAEIRHIRPKSEVQPNLRFSFISSQILAKSRVFAI